MPGNSRPKEGLVTTGVVRHDPMSLLQQSGRLRLDQLLALPHDVLFEDSDDFVFYRVVGDIHDREFSHLAGRLLPDPFRVEES